MNRPVTFRGMKLWLTPGGALAPLDHCDERGEIKLLAESYAHLTRGRIWRHGVVIGQESDLETDSTRGVIAIGGQDV